MRSARKLTAREIAARLDSSSPNAYARYEQGKAMPRIDTLEDLIHAIDPKLNLILKVG
jgi:transcriptional regulator with XRE-family HTH domain